MNLMSKKTWTVAMAAVAISTGTVVAADSAQAAAFTFDFRSQAQTPRIFPRQVSFVTQSQTIGLETLSVTATGFTTAPGGANVFQGARGLGVVSLGSGPGLGNRDSQQIDGLNFLEKLRLTFSPGVRLLSATFGQVGSNDTFNLAVQGVSKIASLQIPGGLPSDNGGTLTGPNPATNVNFVALLSKADRTGTFFDFGTNSARDDYFLSTVTVTPVPTPALLPGLIALGAGMLRKRKAEAAEAVEANN